jgi:hypothetical protein
MTNTVNRHEAARSFENARWHARMGEFTARLAGKENRLLPFEEVRANLRLQNPLYGGVQQVPLDQIVGSIGRYNEFTRQFLPLNDSLRDRWINVEALAITDGWPPIEVYQVGNVYFVRDGNHRTAVARQLGLRTIEAHVWKFPEDLNIDTAATLSEVLIQLGDRRFREDTGIDALYPDHHIRFTSAGRYSELFAQIEEMRQKLEYIDRTPYTFAQAVPAWYELVYLPTIQVIHESGLLNDFPGRTEADLFVWLSLHREALFSRYGTGTNLYELAHTLTEHHREKGLGKMARQVRNLLGAGELPPLEVEEMPAPLSAETAPGKSAPDSEKPLVS